MSSAQQEIKKALNIGPYSIVWLSGLRRNGKAPFIHASYGKYYLIIELPVRNGSPGYHAQIYIRKVIRQNINSEHSYPVRADQRVTLTEQSAKDYIIDYLETC